MRQRFLAAVAIFATAAASTGGLLADERWTDASRGPEIGRTGDMNYAAFDALPFAGPVPDEGAVFEGQPNSDARHGVFVGALPREAGFRAMRADPLQAPHFCGYVFSADSQEYPECSRTSCQQAALDCQRSADPLTSAFPQFRWLSPSAAEFTREDGRIEELSLGKAN